MRCSVFVNEGRKEKGSRALLGAMAAFFDRFAGSGLMGTLCFSMGPEGVSSAFHPSEMEERCESYTSETPSILTFWTTSKDDVYI